MFSFRNLILPVVLGVAVVATAQSGESSSNPTPQQQTTSGSSSVQARIKLRREQRRAQAIKDAYAHLYDASLALGYQRFNLSNTLARVTEYSWVGDFTRYYGDRLGVTLDGRGNYGTAFVKPTQDPQGTSVYHPHIDQYSAMIGPTYRFYMTPKYALSGRVLGGFSHGYFSGDFANQTAATSTGLYKDGATYAANGAIVGEYNISPVVAFRVTGEETLTGYGSSTQLNPGFTLGIVVRFGKQ